MKGVESNFLGGFVSNLFVPRIINKIYAYVLSNKQSYILGQTNKLITYILLKKSPMTLLISILGGFTLIVSQLIYPDNHPTLIVFILLDEFSPILRLGLYSLCIALFFTLIEERINNNK